VERVRVAEDVEGWGWRGEEVARALGGWRKIPAVQLVRQSIVRRQAMALDWRMRVKKLEGSGEGGPVGSEARA
jgi:hypothetical protein